MESKVTGVPVYAVYLVNGMEVQLFNDTVYNQLSDAVKEADEWAKIMGYRFVENYVWRHPVTHDGVMVKSIKLIK